jgi:hypothetical protein
MRGKLTAKETRANAVAYAEVRGVTEAAKKFGVAPRNIRRWKDNPELAELVLSAREGLLDAMRAAIWVGMEEIHAGLVDPAEPLKDKANAVFGLMDRHQLMSGEATARTETRSLASGLDDHERAALKRVLLDELARRQDRERDLGARVDAATAPDSAD